MTSSLKLFTVYFNSLLYKINRLQVAVRLFSNRSQRTSKCVKNISDTLGCTVCATFLFLLHFDVICDLLLNRRTATWNLFVKSRLMGTPNLTRDNCQSRHACHGLILKKYAGDKSISSENDCTVSRFPFCYSAL